MNRHAYRRYVSTCAFALLALVTTTRAKTLSVDSGGKAEFQSIGAAMQAAGRGDIIMIEPGVYFLDATVAAKDLTLSSRDPNSPTTVASTIIDCGYQPLEVGSGNSTSLTLTGLTIRNGRSSFDGGGIQWDGGALTITNCTFTSNTSALWGGAICLRNGTARLTGCTFSGNTSQNQFGGAIFCSNSHLDLVTCTFEANTGSALVAFDSAVTATDCTFRGNSSGDGAAIHCRDDASQTIAPTLNLVKCTFTENASDSCGGAVYLFRTKGTLSACIFTSNTAVGDGGALYSYGTDPSVANCAFVRNTAGNLGGAVASVDGGIAAISIRSCTFVSNGAAVGGAVAGVLQGQGLVTQSIFWKNSAPQGKNLSLAFSPWWNDTKVVGVTVEYTDLEGGQKSVAVGPGCVLDWAPGNIDADPLFIQGSDWNLSAASPCIDRGNPAYSPPSDVADLIGNPRLSGSAVDIGACESSLSPVYRFWSPVTERHFYTINRSERDKLIRDYPKVWTYETVAFYASSRPLDGMVPVYRLWSPTQYSHYYTTDEKEYQRLLYQSPGLWVYEQVAFYVYPPFKQPWGAVPVYQFWLTQRGGQFFTASEGEKDKLMKDTKNWTYQGITWYVFPEPSR